jgi:hypothetical protein
MVFERRIEMVRFKNGIFAAFFLKSLLSLLKPGIDQPYYFDTMGKNIARETRETHENKARSMKL